MASDRHTPYKAQLDRFLASEPVDPFSARTLAVTFDNGRRDEQSTLRGIHAELKQAFADGRLVQFHSADGQPVCEAPAGNFPSQRLRKPPLYGLPRATLPPGDGVVAVSYSDTLAGPNGDGKSNGDVAEGAAPDSDERVQPEPEPDEPPEAEPLTEAEAFERAAKYPPSGSTAPDWVPDRILRAWVALPEVCKHVVHGLDTAKGPDKFEIIRAGVTRKQRSWRPESTVAGNLATMARKSPMVWNNVAWVALKRHYLIDEAFAPATLVRIAADPDGVYDDGEYPPAGVLLCAMALDVDETTLRLIADDCATVLGELTVLDKATAQQERIDTLEAEAVELRRAAKDADKQLRIAAKREKSVSDEVERLQQLQEQAGSAADAERVRTERELWTRAEEAEAHLDELRADAERMPELEARLQGLEDADARLEQAEAALRDEQRLRVQAERDAERHIARVGDLTDQLTRVGDSRNLPIDNPEALVDALARPIGQAARHAAERLAAGRARPHDNLMLELAATLAQMTRRLDAELAVLTEDGTAEVAEEVALTPEATEPPEPVEATPVPIEPAPVGESQPVSPKPEPEEPLADEPPPAARRRRRSRIKVRPLGGAGEVGASAILVTNTSGHTVLLDCGQRVRGEYGLDTEPVFHRRIGQDGRLDAILLTHAHIDHVGSLPLLHREQSHAQHEPIPVYMTAPTRELAEIMLRDSAKIQQYRDVDPAERGFLDYGAEAMQESGYRLPDVDRVLDDEFVREVSLARAQPVPGTSFVARFLPVAHVLGSCAIHLTDTENDQTLLYTGDLGPLTDPQVTLPQYALGEMLGADVVIMESTYGGKTNRDAEEGKRSRRALSGRERAVKQLCQAAEHAHSNGGAVLLPAFSLGRTQELAMLIHQARQDGDAPNGDIVVAGMGERITQVYESYSRGTNPWARAENMPRIDELGKRLRASRDLRFEDVADEILGEGFSYIIASPAMLANGWSRTFLERMVDNPAHAVVMTGYIPRHAGKIPRLHRLRRGETIEFGSRQVRISAEFERLQGLSAHAPSVDLRKFAQFMTRQNEHVAFGMVHGDEAAQRALAQDVAELPNASAEALQNGQVWNPARA